MASPGSRYVQLLDPRAADRLNNGTVPGGIASVLQRMLMAREAQRGQQQETDAYGAMARGMSAKPWVDPDTGKVAPGQAPAGGFEGGIAALQGAGDNPYAGRLASQLMMQTAQMEAEAAQRRAQAEAEFGMKAQLPAAEAAALARAAGIPEGTPEFQEFIRQSARGAGGQETFGNTPIWGTGPDGKPVLMQPSNRGGVKVVDLPPGVMPQRGQVRTVDVGNETVILDANGAFIGRMPKGLGPDRTVQDDRVITLPAVPGGAPMGGAPTGQPRTAEGRPIVNNADGTISTERTITITDGRINGGRPTNIPTMFGGRQVSEDEAVEIIARAGGKDPETGRPLQGYGSIDEAVAAARQRSESLGQYGGGPRVPQATAPGAPTITELPPSRSERRETDKTATEQALRQEERATYADVVVQDIDRALDIVDKATLPTTGFAAFTSAIPGTPAHDVARLLDTVKANAGFDRLQKMREASPTGGALGAVSEFENRLLQSTIGNLEQSQSEEQFKYNLRRVRDIYLDIVHGPGNRPQAGAKPAGAQAPAAPMYGAGGAPPAAPGAIPPPPPGFVTVE